MSQNALRRLATEYCSFINIRRFLPPLQIWERNLSGSGGVKDAGKTAFDVSLLEFLVCPLSKKPLRYDETSNELINEELGIAYPILDGIPNMIPQDARLIKKTEGAEKPTTS
ncbi:protein preY, mitochondrial-like [Hemibagrus wyckioides]|uniref:protein preY, mitochondrial-like n=1 Tax=Hemibagrus wyckioides TaxID=337641 RepID=UPI00266C79CD|nr:protein preY, mitochondrial-like [Hemibagrus wyckioides]